MNSKLINAEKVGRLRATVQDSQQYRLSVKSRLLIQVGCDTLEQDNCPSVRQRKGATLNRTWRTWAGGGTADAADSKSVSLSGVRVRNPSCPLATQATLGDRLTGKTVGFGPAFRGSNPLLPAKLETYATYPTSQSWSITNQELCQRQQSCSSQQVERPCNPKGTPAI
jgi:hypothetical protein